MSDQEVFCKQDGVNIARSSCERRKAAALLYKQNPVEHGIYKEVYKLCFNCPGHWPKQTEVKNHEGGIMSADRICNQCKKPSAGPRSLRLGLCKECRDANKAAPVKKPAARARKAAEPRRAEYRTITIDFSVFPELYDHIIELGTAELRTPELQALKMLKDAIGKDAKARG